MRLEAPLERFARSRCPGRKASGQHGRRRVPWGTVARGLAIFYGPCLGVRSSSASAQSSAFVDSWSCRAVGVERRGRLPSV